MSDAKTILSAFQINEGEGFQLLYNYCYRSLVYFADSIVDDPEAAEDIVQEVFVDFGYINDIFIFRVVLLIICINAFVLPRYVI